MKHILLLAATVSLSITTSLPALADTPDAASFIDFVTLPDEDTSSDCTQRGGMRVHVINTHTESTIDLQIDRYFSGVRQAGRSMFPLASGQRQQLGCNVVMESEQRWELIQARFIDDKEVSERYGQQ